MLGPYSSLAFPLEIGLTRFCCHPSSPNSSRHGSYSLLGHSSRNSVLFSSIAQARKEGFYWRQQSEALRTATTIWNPIISKLNSASCICSWSVRNWKVVSAASRDLNPSREIKRRRNVVEHICLFRAKLELSDEEEKDMLDYLYTTQYQMGGIVAMSLGRISVQNAENFTHAVYMRFQRKEDLLKFYDNPFYLKVMEQRVMPHCRGWMDVDFESEVEDDILSIFRKGEEFNYGVECMFLIAFTENAFAGSIDDALASLLKLTADLPSLVVQSTQGVNFNLSNKHYTHGVVMRFRSFEAFDIFVDSSDYKDVLASKFQMITKKMLWIHYSVDPVDTESI